MATNKKHEQKNTGLGKYAGMKGVIFRSEVDPAQPTKGIVGKGLPKTCNAIITEQMTNRSIKEYDKEQAAKNNPESAKPVDEGIIVDASDEEEEIAIPA